MHYKAKYGSRAGAPRNKTSRERVAYFLEKKCRNVAAVFAKAEFFSQHKQNKHPEYYDTGGKGEHLPKFHHPNVIKYSEKLISEIESKKS